MDEPVIKTEFKPMGVGDIFDTTFRLFKARFATLTAISLVTYVPYAIIALILFIVIPQNAPKSPEDVNLVAMIVAAIPLLILAFIAVPLCQGAMIHNISEAYMGRTISVGESYRRSMSRVGPLLWTNILVGIVVFIGFMLLFVPGIFFTLWFMLATATVIVENKNGPSAMSRSKQLMKGNLDKGLIVLIVIFLLQYAFGFILGMVLFTLNLSNNMLNLITNLCSAIIAPLQIAPIILLYYDLRIRKEGFDLEQLAQLLETTGAPLEANADSPQ